MYLSTDANSGSKFFDGFDGVDVAKPPEDLAAEKHFIADRSN